MVQCSLRLAVGEARTTWRHSSVGQSIRFIPEVSPVRIQVPLPFIKFGHCPFPYSNGPVVKRLRLRPFTAATRVRVPSGSPPIFSRSIWRHSSAGRASASHAEGHRFEFCCLHHAKNHTKRCGSFAILDCSAGDRLQRVRPQILVVFGFGGFAAFTLRRLQCSAEVNSACAAGQKAGIAVDRRATTSNHCF